MSGIVGRQPFGKSGVIGVTGALNIATSDASITPNADANELVVESNGASGITIGSSTSTPGSIRFADSGGNSQGMFYYEHNTDEMRIYTGGSLQVRIDTDGNVGFGLDPSIAEHAFNMIGNAAKNSGTAWIDTSDERIKINIETIANGLDKINKLRPVSYNYTEEYLEENPNLSASKKYNSFIAQEYSEVFPDAVNIGPDLTKVSVEAVLYTDDEELPEGKSIGDIKVKEEREVVIEGMMYWTPHDLFMYIVSAVQELSAKVTALENN